MAVTARELLFKIIGDSEQFNKAVEESTNRLDDFKKKTKDANELFGQVSKQAAVASTAIAALGIAAAKMAKDFNEGFGKVQTLIPGAKERVKEFQDEILNLSPAVGKTTKDLTDGLYEVISAFGDSADSAKNLELAAKGATAGGATTKDSIALLSAVTKGYGDTSNIAQKKVSDLAFTTVKLGQTSFPELAASIQRVTSQSNTLKISQEELFSVFSSGTGVIGGAAEVSTKFSALLTEMQKPGDRLAKTFKALGVESGTELIENFGGLQGALQALKSEAEKTGEPISNLFGSAEAGKLALYASGEGAAKFTSDLQAMNQAAGATEQAFKDATTEGPNAFGFQLQQASLNAQAFAVKVGQELIPTLQSLLNPLFKGVEYLKNLDSQTIKTIVGVGKIILTATALTAAVMGVKKAVDAVKLSMIALKGAFAANPFGLFVVGVTTAIVAIKELCSWLDRASEKQKEVERQALRSSLSFPKEAESAISLSKAYIELADKTNLTAEEKLKLQKQTEQLIQLSPELAGKLSLEESGYKNNLEVLKNFNAEKIKEIELNIQNAKTAHGNISRIIEDNKKHLELLKQTNEYKVNAKGDYGYGINDKQIKKEEAALKELIEKEKIFSEEISKNEILLAQLKDSKTALDSETKDKDAGKNEKSAHAKKLEELDAAFKRETEIISNRNIKKNKKDEELKAVEEKYYNNRLNLLEQFHNENLEKGKTFAQSQKEIVGAANESIKTETEKTNAELSRLADEKHKKEIDDINAIAEKTKKAVEDEISLKKASGLIEGENEKEKNKNALLAKANKYRQKQNELLEEYVKLSASSNEKDKEKAEVIKKQADDIGRLSKEAADEANKAFAEMAAKVAGYIQKIGSSISETFSSIADLAKSIINNKEEIRKQETAKRLVDIEREKNETLLELDNELSEMREQKQQEDSEREEQRRNEEYEKRLLSSERNIQELQGQFEAETNLEKLRNLEKQLEAEKKKKAEEAARKKEEDEKKKRDKEARMQEIALLNARALAEHEFATARIQTENASGDASAKAAQQAAKWQKAQTSVSLAIKAAEQTALAVARFAIPDPIGGAAHTAAAVMAGIQAGVVLAQPLPPDYIQQPLPPAPRLIKFAQGGIVMPSSAGTGISLPNGNAGLVAEAGLPELILPINIPNLQNVFKAAGLNQTDNSKSFSYSPSYSIEISQNSEKSLDEALLNVLRSHDRELLNIVETGKQNWFVGD
ncbi:phage tail tape measure protein, TP901 family, core region [Treponema denticola MYR-T]|uniref:Phage tail tape measure protein, TP901 family, core region n=1 Tax=Treponema denticola H1-T TaxID=999431 RepID=M2BIX6_TREDN|nr:phage tail tape measure protein [Treponema denticola]EMB28618.1 phage tail tape measure protein, TP901 family, core region [Treponema denticola MYR-T]EMB29360.1 phage tail tape measure protein, TP901 family, core region [Treponema denticola H1-T]